MNTKNINCQKWYIKCYKASFFVKQLTENSTKWQKKKQKFVIQTENLNDIFPLYLKQQILFYKL